MIITRKPKPEDTLQLELIFQRLRQKIFLSQPSKKFQIGDYAKSVENDEVWVAQKNENIIGVVSTYPAENFIHNLFVHVDHQRCGVGSRLLKIAEDNLDRPMRLKVALENRAVCSFYEKRGWIKFLFMRVHWNHMYYMKKINSKLEEIIEFFLM